MLKYVLLSVTLINLTAAYSSGAPAGACGNLMPGHGIDPQNSASSPFSFKVNAPTTITSGGQVTITVGSDTGRQFKGFLLVAETINAQKIRRSVGTFAYDQSLVKATCADTKGITHKNSTPKNNLQVTWTAPSNFEGKVDFWGSVVQEYNTFWVELKGTSSVMVQAPTTTTGTTTAATTTTTTTTTTPAPITTQRKLTTGNLLPSRSQTVTPQSIPTHAVDPGHTTDRRQSTTTTTPPMAYPTTTKAPTTTKKQRPNEKTKKPQDKGPHAGHPHGRPRQQASKDSENSGSVIQTSIWCLTLAALKLFL